MLVAKPRSAKEHVPLFLWEITSGGTGQPGSGLAADALTERFRCAASGATEAVPLSRLHGASPESEADRCCRVAAEVEDGCGDRGVLEHYVTVLDRPSAGASLFQE